MRIEPPKAVLSGWRLPLIACICAIIWFFRDFFQFGFDRVAGDIGDNRFIIAILEHWRHIFLGQITDFTSPIFFYPEKGLAFAIAIVPFMRTYLPAIQRTGGRGFEEVAMYMAAPIDLYNVGPLNVVWSSLLHPYFQSIRSSQLEMSVGWPPGTIAVFAALIGLILWQLCRYRSVKPALVFAAAAGITCTGLWLLTLLYNDFAPWWYVFKFVPGAAAIRVPARFNVVLNALGIIAIVIGMAHVSKKSRSGAIKAAVGCVLALLIVEQVNVQRLHLISRRSEASMLSRVAAPPSECKSFYVVNAAYPGRPFYATHIEAMLISQQLNLPTLNGYSGWFPADWKLFTFNKDYVENANQWARSKGIASGLCSLDLASGAWSTPKSGL